MAPKPRLQVWTAQIQSSFQNFFSRSSSAGIAILTVAAIAMIWANSPFAALYHSLLHQPVHAQLFNIHVQFSFEQFVNDGLMTLFFLLVGLEIKRELLIGELSSVRNAALPIIAALAGMIVPGLIYTASTYGTPVAHGWGIPVATDIAFALGVLALLGKRVPLGLKVFLAALAIADDLFAVGIIALFYSAQIDVTSLLGAAAVIAFLTVVRRAGIMDLRMYAVAGVVLWWFVLNSGIHATIAGIVLAFMVPARSRIAVSDFVDELSGLTRQLVTRSTHHEAEGFKLDVVHAIEQRTEDVQSALQRMQHGLQVPVDYLVLPLFALINAGVVLNSAVVQSLDSPLSVGIILGLVIGKPLGIITAVWASIRFGIATYPSGVELRHIYGVGMLCGIGFTMALFVTQLTFSDSMLLDVARISVFIASAISAVLGLIGLHLWLPREQKSISQ